MSKQENKHSGEKNSHFGTCWITKDNKSIVIKKELLNQYLNDGWVKGRKIQNKENIVNANKDKYWINKDGKTKFIYLDKLDEYLNNGWERGRVHNSPKYTYHEPKPHYNPWKGNVLVEIDGKKYMFQKMIQDLKLEKFKHMQKAELLLQIKMVINYMLKQMILDI